MIFYTYVYMGKQEEMCCFSIIHERCKFWGERFEKTLICRKVIIVVKNDTVLYNVCVCIILFFLFYLFYYFISLVCGTMLIVVKNDKLFIYIHINTYLKLHIYLLFFVILYILFN